LFLFLVKFQNVNRICDIYRLESEIISAVSLYFGQQKINLHEQGKEFELKVQTSTPGSADLCFIVIAIVQGPINRTVARCCRSFILRDPDGNLIELSGPIA